MSVGAGWSVHAVPPGQGEVFLQALERKPRNPTWAWSSRSPFIKLSKDAQGLRCRVTSRASPASDLKSPLAPRSLRPGPQHELPTAGGPALLLRGRGSEGGDWASQGRGSVAGGRSGSGPGARRLAVTAREQG